MNLCSQEIMKGISHYLEWTGQLSNILFIIKNAARVPKTDEKLPITLNHIIQIDFTTLVDVAGDVANFLLSEPNEGHKLFNKVINEAVITDDTFHPDISGQIRLDIQVTLPFVPHITYFPDKPFITNGGLFVIKGVIVAHSMLTKYCRSSLYRCPVKNCPGHEGERVYDDRILAGVCSTCGHQREEFLRARVNGDQISAVFVHPQSFHHNFSRHQGLTIVLRDDLVQNIRLGVCYNVVANYKAPHFLAWGIEQTISEHQWRFDRNWPPVDIPSSILKLGKNLMETCPKSPWAFTVTLATQIVSHLYPLGSFFQLKTGLLLSLASQSEEKVPAAILAVGPDCSSLLQAASQLSRRRVAVTSPTLSGTLSGSAGSLWLEAGPLLLATSGVCYIGDWAKFGSGRSSQASQIITALEGGQVDLVSSNNSTLGSPPSFPLRAAVWTFWSGDKTTSAARAQLQTLIEIFGMPFIGDGSADIEAVAEHLLCKAIQLDVKPPDDLISTEDLKQYLNIVCSIKVNLEPEASRLLRNYFVASRRNRPNCLPLSSIKTMTALAEAHARLCLRTSVLYQDVVLVIYLYEEAITVLFGPSVLSPPPKMFEKSSFDLKGSSIGQQVDISLKNFTMWLEQYIKSLLGEGSICCSLPEE